MTDFTILMYEDETDWKDSFEYGIKDRLAVNNKRLRIEHRLNSDSIDADLLCNADLIMIDHDLGEITGEEILEAIDGDPDYQNASIFYYSGGESLDDLEQAARRFNCNIRCFTKEGDELDNAVLGKA